MGGETENLVGTLQEHDRLVESIACEGEKGPWAGLMGVRGAVRGAGEGGGGGATKRKARAAFL